MVEAIRLHVDAKRALCALEPDYYEALSEDSKRSLTLQGGIFSKRGDRDVHGEALRGERAARCGAGTTGAKIAGESTPGLSHFLDTAARCLVH